ncbi:MAG TPA: hypothetical protein VEO95_05295, partial [Chthoniobacteraceae bacterium]|nr:hypothetical protein [Chthoniobacteraceae bacterium]
MKFLQALLAAALLAAPHARADENRYDVLGKMLAPFVNVLAKNTRNPNRALSLAARLERLTGAPPELAGTRAELSLQYPDRALIHGPILGEDLTVCRDRQRVWAVPGAKVKALLDLAAAQKKLRPVDPDSRIAPLQLPVPEKELVFLPMLFVVKDAGAEDV